MTTVNRTRIDAILDAVRRELEKRPGFLEGGGLQSLSLQLYFEGETWSPRAVIVRPEFKSSVEERRKGA
jgi:hypothetical protein